MEQSRRLLAASAKCTELVGLALDAGDETLALWFAKTRQMTFEAWVQFLREAGVDLGEP